MITHRYTSKEGALIGDSGVYAGSIIKVAKCTEVKIGRDPKACDVVISSNSANISRVHCSVSYDAPNNCYIIKDSSTNGTIIKTHDDKTLIKSQTSKAYSGNIIYLGDEKNSFKLL